MVRKKVWLFLVAFVWNFYTLAIVSGQSMTYRIDSIDFQLKSRGWLVGGNTQKNPLMQRIRLKEGMTFDTLESLNLAARFWENELNQFRVFLGNASVTYILDYEEDNIVSVILIVAVEEGVNIMALPSFKVTSDEGTSVGLRFSHYNFLGTMEPLRLRSFYQLDDESRHGFNNSLDFTYLVNLKDHYYGLGVTLNGGYQSPMSSDFVLFNSGLKFGSFWIFGSIYRPITQLDFSVGQEVHVLGESKANHRFENNELIDTHYFTSSASGGAWFNIFAAPWIKNAWLRYNVSLKGEIDYRFDSQPLEEKRRGLNVHFNNSFSYGAVELLSNNFKRGYLFEVYNNNSFNFFRMKHFGLAWSNTPANKSGYRLNLGTEARAYLPLHEQFAVNMRIGIDYQPWQREDGEYDVKEDWSSRVRGVRNDSMRGDALFYWNLELEADVWMWRFANFFNTHGVLFFDGGMMHSSIPSTSGWQDPFLTMGFEVRVVPLGSRNMTTRVSVGMNISRWFGWDSRGSKLEFYIGNELHF